MNNYQKVTLESANLYFEEDGSGPYMQLVYLVDTQKEIFEVVYPKVLIGVPKNVLPYESVVPTNGDLKYSHGRDGYVPVISMLSGMDVPILEASGVTQSPHDGFDIKYQNARRVVRVIDKKTIDMTIEEVEKALGHKVRIVGEK